MKKRIINLSVALMLSVIWLFPFRSNAHEWILTAGFAASFICLCLIPQKYLAFALSALIAVGMCFYDLSFAACFAPAIFFVLIAYAAISENTSLPIKKDGFFCLSMAIEAVCIIVSVCYTFISIGNIEFEISSFERYYIYIIIAFVLTAFLLYKAVSKQKNLLAKNKKATDRSYERLAAVYSAGLLCIAAVSLFCLKHTASISLYTLPIFICVYSAASESKTAELLFSDSGKNA